MSTLVSVLSVVGEVLSWITGLAFLCSALVLLALAFGQHAWRQVEAVVEPGEPPLLRWFGAEGVGQAKVPDEDSARVADRSTVTVFVHPAHHDRFRWTRAGRTAHRALAIMIGSGIVFVVALAASLLPALL